MFKLAREKLLLEFGALQLADVADGADEPDSDTSQKWLWSRELGLDTGGAG